MRILISSLIFFGGTFCAIILVAILNKAVLSETGCWMLATVLFVFVIMLTARYMFGAVR